MSYVEQRIYNMNFVLKKIHFLESNYKTIFIAVIPSKYFQKGPEINDVVH